ncbi:Ig domain-containing protein [Paenibacillus sp. MWE-103]|uniref:Ig domain-containing protein n=1 Tax=Paenibacillus artemisiicola TaxID=1172618 RepID=A0ABS3WFQ2_9BACL|nr:Ig domain-containing protein [Paenibacillus artemisiicola]
MTSSNDAGPVPVTGVTLDSGALAAGESASLIANFQPVNATNKAVSWSSSAPAVASVDAKGKVTAVSSGTAVITATTADGSFTASCAGDRGDPAAVRRGGVGFELTSVGLAASLSIDQVTVMPAAGTP